MRGIERLLFALVATVQPLALFAVDGERLTALRAGALELLCRLGGVSAVASAVWIVHVCAVSGAAGFGSTYPRAIYRTVELILISFTTLMARFHSRLRTSRLVTIKRSIMT